MDHRKRGRLQMTDSAAYRKMLEGKITSKKYAKDLKKSVRKARNASTGKYLRHSDSTGRASA
jgi:hypothetical protein